MMMRSHDCPHVLLFGKLISSCVFLRLQPQLIFEFVQVRQLKTTNHTRQQTRTQSNMSGFNFGPFLLWEDLPTRIPAAMTILCAKYDAYQSLSEKSFRMEIGDHSQEEQHADLQVLRFSSGSLVDDATADDVEEEARQDHLHDLRCDDDREEEDELRDTDERRWRPPIDMENLQLPLDF